MLHHLLAGIDGAPLLVELVSGLDEIDSAAPTRSLWQLGRSVRESEVLTRHFDEGVTGVLDRLRADSYPACVAYLQGFEDFLCEYGSRGTDEWDFATVIRETEPEIAFGMVERMRMQDDGEPTRNAARLREQRERPTENVHEMLSGDGLGRRRGGQRRIAAQSRRNRQPRARHPMRSGPDERKAADSRRCNGFGGRQHRHRHVAVTTHSASVRSL
jgi:hypothetical protein